MIAILEEGIELNASRFGQAQMENKILQVRILDIPS